MTGDNKPNGFYTELGSQLQSLPREITAGWRRIMLQLRNDLRHLRGASIEYIVIPVGGSLPERAEPPRSFIQRQLPLPPRPLSLQTLNYRFRTISDAKNVKGVVLHFQGFSGVSLARLQNLRSSIHRLRESGKEVVVYTSQLDLPHYYAASAADLVIAPPSAEFSVLGIAFEIQFLKDALDRIGVQADVVQISPYKSAFDQFAKAEMSPELREQNEWLLNDIFDMITGDIAGDRGMPVEELHQLIDRGPCFAPEAQQRGLLDHVLYFDELPFVLHDDYESAPQTANDEAGRLETGAPAVAERGDDTANGETADAAPLARPTPEAQARSNGKRPRVELRTWGKARPLLLEKYRRAPRKYVAVISLEGNIVDGTSQNPPIDLPIPLLGGATAGDQTLTALLRQVEKDHRVCALLLYVDSPGGSALASDLIMRDLKRVAQKMPVIAYMGGVAASGGYYVSAPAGHIMSQRATVTGSIGVINARLSTVGLLERLSINQTSVQRGKYARLYRSNEPMTEEEYASFWNSITAVYSQFKRVVADGRGLQYEALDPICEGRVWTGKQALDHGLVDSHGDFLDAVRKAAELGGLPVDDDHHVPVLSFFPGARTFQLPKPFEAAESIARLVISDELRRFSGRALMFMPFDFRLW